MSDSPMTEDHAYRIIAVLEEILWELKNGSIQTALSSVQGDISVIQTHVSNIQGDISLIQSDVSVIQSDASSISTDVSLIQGNQQ